MERYWPQLLEGEHLEYRPRGEMEEDPSFKQLIPYVLFRWTDAEGQHHLFEYTRGSGQASAGCTPSGAWASAGTSPRLIAATDSSHDAYREGMRPRIGRGSRDQREPPHETSWA